MEDRWTCTTETGKRNHLCRPGSNATLCDREVEDVLAKKVIRSNLCQWCKNADKRLKPVEDMESTPKSDYSRIGELDGGAVFTHKGEEYMKERHGYGTVVPCVRISDGQRTLLPAFTEVRFWPDALLRLEG